MLATDSGVSVQELSLEEVVPTSLSSGMLDDGKLDLVMVTVPETATVEVRTKTRSKIAKHSVFVVLLELLRSFLFTD